MEPHPSSIHPPIQAILAELSPPFYEALYSALGVHKDGSGSEKAEIGLGKSSRRDSVRAPVKLENSGVSTWEGFTEQTCCPQHR